MFPLFWFVAVVTGLRDDVAAEDISAVVVVFTVLVAVFLATEFLILKMGIVLRDFAAMLRVLMPSGATSGIAS